MVAIAPQRAVSTSYNSGGRLPTAAPGYRHHRGCASTVAHAMSRRNSAQRRLPSIPADDVVPPPSPSSSTADGKPSDRAQPIVNLPRTGYLALADPKAEIYSKASERFDPEKKLDRWKPEFIWNTNWQQALARQESLERSVKLAKEARANAPPEAGELSFSRLDDLNRMDVDLSSAFAAASQRHAEKLERRRLEAEKLAAAAMAGSSGDGGMSRNDVRKLTRVTARMARAKPSGRLFSSEAEQAAARAAEAAAQSALYEKLKADFQVWTVGLTAVSAVSTYVSYGRDVTLSYVVGAVGGFVYLRLLGRSVDAVGGVGGVGAGLASAAAQPRLLIPVGLALVFNRWNLLYAASTGVTLHLLPILAGFFTYKLAVFARQAKEVLQDMSIKPREDPADGVL